MRLYFTFYWELKLLNLQFQLTKSVFSGGRIDHSHHFNNAHRALTDTLAFEDAVSVALDMTRSEDTLIVVTSDHSHVFAFGGNPKRGNPILGEYAL